MTLSQKVLESLIGFFRRAKPGKLAHCPKLAAVAGRMDTSRIRELTWIRDVAIKVDVLNVRRTVETVDLFERNSLEISFTLALALEGGLQNLFFPAFLGFAFRRGFFDLSHLPGSLTKGGAVARTDKSS